jgi:protein gp37
MTKKPKPTQWWVPPIISPVIGCNGRNCRARCWAKTQANRWYRGPDGKPIAEWRQDGVRIYTRSWEATLRKANDRAAKTPFRKPFFLGGMGDLFEEHGGPIMGRDGTRLLTRDTPGGVAFDGFCTRDATLDDVRRRVFSVIDECPNLRIAILTKQVENVRAMWPIPISRSFVGDPSDSDLVQRSNVWLLCSASTQADYDRMAQELWLCRDLAAVIGWHFEPLLEPIDLGHWAGCWGFCVCGGESGPDARPFRLDWARSLRDQCRAASVKCWVKQVGSRPRTDYYEDDDAHREYVLNRPHTVLQHVGRGEYAEWDHATFGQPSPRSLIEWTPRDRNGADSEEWAKDLRMFELPEVTR